MRLFKYINEKKIIVEDLTLENIKEKCKDFFDDMKQSKIRLYRGENVQPGGYNSIIKRQMRKNRNPKDSSPTLHNFLNSLFFEAYNINLRSDSLFCTTNKFVASGYGHMYIVVPSGNYTLYWSENIIDAFNVFEEWNTVSLEESIKKEDYYLLSMIYFFSKIKNREENFLKKLKYSVGRVLVEYYMYNNEKYTDFRQLIDIIQETNEELYKSLFKKYKTNVAHEIIDLEYGIIKNQTFSEYWENMEKEIIKNSNDKKILKEFIQKYYKKSNTIKDLTNTKMEEIMLVCDEYYLIPRHFLKV